MTNKFPEFIEVELTTPLKAVYKGDKNDYLDCKKLYLKANTPKHKEQTRELKRLFMRAIAYMMNDLRSNKEYEEQETAQEDNKKDNKLDKAWVISMLQLSDIDLNKYIRIFKKFALKDICFTDKDFKHLIKSEHFDNLSEDDEENLIASYLEVFFILSWYPTIN